MKRIKLVFLVLIMTLVLSACEVGAEAIENVDIEDYSLLYSGENYTVFVKKDIDPDAVYTRIAHGIGHSDDDTCVVGDYEAVNYIFLYKDNYYDIVEFNKFRIIECSDLEVIGVKGEDD